MLAETRLPNDEEKQRKGCVFMARARVCVHIVVRVKDIVELLGYSETFLDSQEVWAPEYSTPSPPWLSILTDWPERSHYSLSTHRCPH